MVKRAAQVPCLSHDNFNHVSFCILARRLDTTWDLGL